MALRSRSNVKFGATPRVDLLPDAQRSELLHERVMLKLLLAIVASAAVAGLIAAIGLLPKYFADQRLRDAEATSQELLTQIAEHAETQAILNTSAKLSNAREQLTEREVLFAELADEVDEKLPEGAEITSYTGSLPALGETDTLLGSGGGEVDLNPLCVADTATLTVKIVGENLAPASALAERLEGVTGYRCLLATLIERETPVPEVMLQFALGEEALAQRFTEEAE